MSSGPIWVPPRAIHYPIDIYREHINKKFSQSLQNSVQLHEWTVTHPHEFWIDLYRYLKLIPSLPHDISMAYDDSQKMNSIPTFFKGHCMNYAENVLCTDVNPNAIALIGLREDDDLSMTNGESVTWAELRERVRTLSSALRRHGIRSGDRVAALVSNSIWAVILFLSSASIGAVFSSINPDLGVEGCLARLQQVTPSLLFCDSDATYKERNHLVEPKVKEILRNMQQKPDVYVIPVRTQPSIFQPIADLLAKASPFDGFTFESVPFSHPLMICYSSGTTGPPKCIVHQHGFLLNAKKVSMLHSSLGPGDVVLQYSSTTWIMFYIMNGHLSAGATCICYDGSPMYPDIRRFMHLCAKFRVTYLGTSPRYLLELEIARIRPKYELDISMLRRVSTTGAPLTPEQYDWFYANFPHTTQLCNSAGGTETATSVLVSNPSGPVHRGELQMMGLGMDVDILDSETGKSIMQTGHSGEMVIRKPFPSMPIFFWGDRDGKIYSAAYFERFGQLDVWTVHDWLSYNPVTGGFVMNGRSDGVLNPSGIRFGSGEIYAISEGPNFNSEIAETLCVGRRRPGDTDETVFLFVKMLPGCVLSTELKHKLRVAIGNGLSRRHVPTFLIQVQDIPVTINGKKVEIAVKQLISGKDIKISSTVANPETLRAYAKYKDVEKEARAQRL